MGASDFSRPERPDCRLPRFLYLVHDLSDPAVRRRVMMFQAGGAKVALAGFRRSQNPVASIETIDPIELGQTENGDFIQRILAVAKSTLTIGRNFADQTKPDVIVARNLEMLALAIRIRRFFGGSDIRIVYECLDIHRLMSRRNRIGSTLRGLEKHLVREASLIITSSPGFIRNHFKTLESSRLPIEIVENKHLELGHDPASEQIVSTRQTQPPWKIGWFGALRCERSLEVLAQFAHEQKGQFRIVLRGIPSLDVFPDFYEFVESQPYMSFEGPYKNPEDLAAIYADIHFSWVIDLFEAGQNSAWLLPNRLYEGCRFAAIPIALTNTETAEFLSSLKIGIPMNELSASELTQTLGHLTGEQFKKLRNAVTSHPRKIWASDQTDCQSLVLKVTGASATGRYSARKIASPSLFEKV